MAGTTLQQIHALKKQNEKQNEEIKKLKEQNAVNEKIEDIYKVIAFQFAQTHGLFKGLEIYTKEDAIDAFPWLKNPILRKTLTKRDMYCLNVSLLDLIEIAEEEIKTMPYLEEKLEEWN